MYIYYTKDNATQYKCKNGHREVSCWPFSFFLMYRERNTAPMWVCLTHGDCVST